jgi:hypothetical protein
MHVLSISQIKELLNVRMSKQKGRNAAFFAAFDPGGIANYLGGFLRPCKRVQLYAVLVYTVKPRGNGV